MKILDILYYFCNLCIKNYEQTLEKENKVSLEVESERGAFQLNSIQTQYFPAMISLDITPLINNQNKNQRAPIDIVCVIDTSSSMDGQKIEYVREALNILVSLLNENDRIMLVKFESQADELLPFTNVSSDNIPNIRYAIQQLQSSGGTSILSGLKLAIEGLQNRKLINPITSVFLLSDGQDDRSSIDYLKQNGNLKDSPYTIHTFGFGQDHDSVLLNDICKVMDGNFYYVEYIETVDQQFIEALGGLFSIVAQEMEVTVKLKNHVNREFNKISVSKTYGDMWVYNPDKNEYTIQIKQFMKDVGKEFFLDLLIPPIQHNLKQNERKIEVLQVETTLYDNIDNKKQNPIKKVNQLTLTLFNENEKVPIIAQETSERFEVNYFRVRGADAIGQSIQKNRNGDFKKAQQILEDFNDQIQNSRKYEKLKVLQEDIQECMYFCDPIVFQQEQGKMISIQKSHMEKKTRSVFKAESIKSLVRVDREEYPQPQSMQRIDHDDMFDVQIPSRNRFMYPSQCSYSSPIQQNMINQYNCSRIR